MEASWMIVGALILVASAAVGHQLAIRKKNGGKANG